MKHVNPRSVLETKNLPLELKEADPNPDPVLKAIEELKESAEEFKKTHSGRLDELEKKTLAGMQKRIDELTAKVNRPGQTQENDEPSLERKAFTGYLRGGREALGVEEVKSLIVGDDVKGGYLAPPEFVAEVIKGIVEFSPVRQAARVGNTSAGSVILPKRGGKPTAHWVGEIEARPETGSTYGQLEIPVHEMACFVDVSMRLLEDSAVNVEAEVSGDLAEEFGRLEGASFVNGNGVKKPAGFMQDGGVAFTLNGHASDLSADAMITMLYAMPAYYRNRGSWTMNGTTLGTVRKLKDPDNRYMWQPALSAGQPETILGRPVIEAVDMDNATSGEFPIAFGDFATAYRIYDRIALSVMRDQYSVATSGLVRFHARRRLGGGVVVAEAIRKLKMST